MDWEEVPREEQETLINIDYEEKKVKVYTSRKSVARRLIKRLGEPKEYLKNKDKIYGIDYEFNFDDEKVSKVVAKSVFIGNFSRKK